MNLDALRAEVDRIDDELVSLLNQRADCAVRIGQAKRQQNLAVTDRRREAAVLARVQSMNRGPLKSKALMAVYKAIMAACRGLQDGK